MREVPFVISYFSIVICHLEGRPGREMTNEKCQIANDKWRPEVNSMSVNECPRKDVPDHCRPSSDEHANVRHCLSKASRVAQ